MRKKTIIYDPSLEVEKKESFVSTKLEKEVSNVKRTLDNIPGAGKWLIALFVGAFISTLIQVTLMFYFSFGFDTFEEIDFAIRIQFLIDAIVIAMIGVFIGLLIKESRS